MPEFTADQKRAIYENGCDILVSAAAGSGKTAVLSERVLNKLLSGHDITEFLVVTFTNAAAAEMKERISRKISEKIEESEKNAFLSRQLTLIGKASITTIHSFCLDIIKNNFHLLEIDPAFKIADDSETELLKLESADETLEFMYEHDPIMTDRLCSLFGGKDETLENEIIRLYDFTRSLPEPERWLDEQCEAYNSDVPASELIWTKYLKHNAYINLCAIKSEFEKLYKYAADLGLNYTPALERDTASLEKLCLAAKSENNEFYDILGAFSFGSIGKKSKDEDESICKEIGKKRDDLKKRFGKIQSDICGKSFDEIAEEIKSAYPLALTLKKCVNTFSDIFMRKKHDSALIDFSDFEHMAMQILKDPESGVADRLRERYTEIFVDEYQDCNPAQETLFSYISRKKDGKSTNMFMVGDIKQSIYRFRQADPGIFSEKSKTYTSDGIQRKICLNKNFRSSSNILDCINDIFSVCMNEETGGVDYGDEERLYYRSGEIPENEPKCELLIVDSDSDADDTDEPEDKIGYEARLIAKRILQLKADGGRFSDCAVLMRSVKNNIHSFETEFKKIGIPYYVDGGGGFFDSFEIRLFMSVLKICDNPYQDIPLTGVLFSPLFNFTESDLLKIRMCHSGSFYKAIIKYNGEDETKEKCENFLNTLALWRDTAVSLTVEEFCRYLCNELCFDDFILCLPGGEGRKSNLDLFLKQVEGFADMGINDLFGFIQYIDRLSAGGDSAGAKTLSENADVVRIMSIHKSKGLQFKNVFVAGCGKKLNVKDSVGNLLYHKNLGIGLTMINPAKHIKYKLISQKAIAAAMKSESISEEMRILYVALTRAETRLICTASVKKAKERDFFAETKSAVSASSYLDWICAGLSDKWVLNIFGKDELSPETVSADTSADFAAGESSEYVKNALSYSYPHEKAAHTPVKLSVSEIKKAGTYDDPTAFKMFAPELKTYPEFIEKKDLSGANIGTVNHLVLKEIDMKNPSVEECIARLKRRKLLTENEEQYVYTEKISKFISGDIFARMQKSPKVLREFSFNMPVKSETVYPSLCGETILIQGIADCIFEENGEYVIVDYKTDSFVSPKRLEEYKKQIEIYARAAEIITSAAVKEKIIYLIKDEKAIYV